MEQYYIPLEDELIRLEPITLEHIQQMLPLSSDSDVWRWYTEDLTHPEDLKKWMMKLLDASRGGSQMTYAVLSKSTNEVVGSSSYGHIDWEEHCIEIGWTWLAKKYIGTGINKHMKFLMLQHAFSTMQIERLELRTDEDNIRSRKAMEKIGAKYDGTLRSHRATQGGRRRNTVLYSILRGEWPSIRTSIFNEF